MKFLAFWIKESQEKRNNEATWLVKLVVGEFDSWFNS